MARRRQTSDRRSRRAATTSPSPSPGPSTRASARAPRAAAGGWRRAPSDLLREVLIGIRAQPLASAIGAAIVGASLVLYIATAARDIVYGDSPELTAVALTLGVAHPPGYPIFTTIGWLFGQLPVGPLPFRIALLSAVCNAATIGVIYAATFRFARSTAAAAAAAAVLATAPLFWRWSIVPEVFPLNDLLASTMLLLVALWHEHPERRRLLIAGALVGGLGVANHQTIVLLAPAVFYVLWLRRRPLLRDMRLIRQCAIAFAIGLVPYLELPLAALRHPVWSWGDIHTPGDLVGHFLRKSYGTAQLITDPNFVGGSLIDRVASLFSALDAVQLALVAVGTAFALFRLRWYATYLLLAFGLSGPVFIAYTNAKVSDATTLSVLERFFLLPHVVIAPLAGFAVLAGAAALARVRIPERMARAVLGTVAVGGALAVVPLWYHELDQSDNHLARIFGEDLLATLKPNSLFLAGGDPVVFSVGYLQTIEGARPDVVTVQIPLVPADWYINELRRRYPDLGLPFDRFGPEGGPIRSLIDANKSRPLAAIGDLPDNSATTAYWFYSRGIVFELRALADRVILDDMVVENEAILAMYHPPRLTDLPSTRVWERLTLVDYSLAYYRVGHEFEIGADSLKKADPKRAGDLYGDARRWYERALAIMPGLKEAVEGLARLPG